MSFLKRYPSFSLTEDEVKVKVADLLKDVSNHETSENFTSIFSMIDLTSLNSSNTFKTIECFIDQLNGFSKTYPNYENVAAICVYPPFVSQIKDHLKPETGVKIASVAACFPSSQTYLEVKKKECELALLDGADELDIVISLKFFLEKNYNKVLEEIKIIKNICGTKHLKVILETGVLKTPTLIYEASLLAMEAGADFIKTSTGKLEPAATLEAVYVMCVAINEFKKINGGSVGLKAAGGISTGEEAMKYYVLVKKILGDAYLNKDLFRFGASKLANEILTKIEGGAMVNYFGEKFPKDEIVEKKFTKEKNSKGEKENEKSSKMKENEKIKFEVTKKIRKNKFFEERKIKSTRIQNQKENKKIGEKAEKNSRADAGTDHPVQSTFCHSRLG